MRNERHTPRRTFARGSSSLRPTERRRKQEENSENEIRSSSSPRPRQSRWFQPRTYAGNAACARLPATNPGSRFACLTTLYLPGIDGIDAHPDGASLFGHVPPRFRLHGARSVDTATYFNVQKDTPVDGGRPKGRKIETVVGEKKKKKKIEERKERIETRDEAEKCFNAR